MAEINLPAPNISQEDLLSFHASHFSSISIHHFADQFLGPVEAEEEYHDADEEEEDGLGYYADGVKRTLTDDQISIFRHSEIEALLRDRRHAEEADDQDSSVLDDTRLVANESVVLQDVKHDARFIGPIKDVAAFEDGEIEEEATPCLPPHSQGNKKGKRKKNKSARKGDQPPQSQGFFKQNVKPDLRKRTWDKVDTGLANLDYDEDTAGLLPTPALQRKRISYDDD